MVSPTSLSSKWATRSNKKGEAAVSATPRPSVLPSDPMPRLLHTLVLALIAVLVTASSAAAFTPKTALRANGEFSPPRVGQLAPYPGETPRQNGFRYGQIASDSPLAARGLAGVGKGERGGKGGKGTFPTFTTLTGDRT